MPAYLDLATFLFCSWPSFLDASRRVVIMSCSLEPRAKELQNIAHDGGAVAIACTRLHLLQPLKRCVRAWVSDQCTLNVFSSLCCG